MWIKIKQSENIEKNKILLAIGMLEEILLF